MSDLASRPCEPCRGGVPPLSAEETAPLLRQIDDDWEIVDGHHLERSFDFDDFLTESIATPLAIIFQIFESPFRERTQKIYENFTKSLE